MKRSALALAITLMVGCAASLPTHQKGAALILSPRISDGAYQTQATVSVYTLSSIDHLVLKLYQGSTEVANKTVPKAALSNPVAFSNLRNNTPYRIKAYAYLADETLISHDDASSWLDITTLTDDRPAISPIPVHLKDIPFNGNATSSIQVTGGGYTLPGPETMQYPFSGVLSTLAGNGTGAFSGDGGPAINASLNRPAGMTFDSSGNLVFADYANQRIRKINPDGKISTLAGNGGVGSGGDGGQATNASMNTPLGVALDAAGNLYIAEYGNHCIRKVDKATGVISRFAGNGTATYGGDGGQATSASFYQVQTLTFDSSGNLFAVDRGNHRIRKIAPNGVVSTFAGNGTAAYSGDGGQATAASINNPNWLAFDAAGNAFIADRGNHRIRRVDKATGVISTFAGNGTATFAGDGAQATAASFNSPIGICFDASGNLFVADCSNHRIRKITPTGIISTFAGNGTSAFAGDGGQATAGSFNSPTTVLFDANGLLYISEENSHRIRVVK